MVPVLVGCLSRCAKLSSTNREGFRQIGVRAKPWEELSYSLARVVVLWKHLQLQGLCEMPLDGLGLVAAVCWAPMCEGMSCSCTSILALTAPVPLGVALVTANAAQSSLALLGTPELHLPLLGARGLGCRHQVWGESRQSGQLSFLPSSHTAFAAVKAPPA